MSARVLNPAMMSELGHRGGMVGSSRVAPSRVALARVRRDLFGPVDHTAARALAERELRAQSILDAERWGFDFHLEIPRENSRYYWEPVTQEDIVPEPYALRGMPYLRRNSPGTPRKCEDATATATTTTNAATTSSSQSCSRSVDDVNATTTTTITATLTRKRTIKMTNVAPINTNVTPVSNARKAERTPPQEPRVPDIGDNGSVVCRSRDNSEEEEDHVDNVAALTCRRKKIKCIVSRESTTPVLNAATRKQSSITDYMKSRKRTLNGSTKSIVELPEKIARNAGQIRS